MFSHRTAIALLVGVVILCWGAQPAIAQNTPSPNGVEVTKEGNVSLDFREADIRNVLEVLSFKSGVNIVASPEVTGSVSIKLNDVPWRQALEVILQTYGYAYDRKGNIILVTTVEDLKKKREDAMLLSEQQPLETETFVVNFGKAADIIESIDKMKSDRGSINYDERTNTIIVTDVQEKLELVGLVIEKLDTTTPQVLIEAKILETTLGDTENLGINWTAAGSITGSARPHTFPFKGTTTNDYASSDAFPGATSGAFTYGTLDFSSLAAALEMLSTRDDTNILSSPRIVTLDNQPAMIEVGTEHPIPTYSNHPETGALQVAGLEYKNIGITFEVTPHVNDAGFVTLDIKPTVSETNASVTFETITVPLISIEKASTTVMVKDGETLVIAGLIKDKTVDRKRKLPILGDIPLVGLAFSTNNKTVEKTDLIIFMTPHIITPEIAQN